MTNEQIKKTQSTKIVCVLSLVIAAFAISGCGRDSGQVRDAVHVIEVADPGRVVAQHGDNLDSFLNALVQSGETTFVVIANHTGGYTTQIPADTWFWQRWAQLSSLEDEILKAANATVLTNNYETKLHRIYREVYGGSQDFVLVRSTVLGGSNGMVNLGDGGRRNHVGDGQHQEMIAQSRTNSIKQIYPWTTILGTWIWTFGLIATLVVGAYGWYQLGKKVHR
jgi:hypothetical protein